MHTTNKFIYPLFSTVILISSYFITGCNGRSTQKLVVTTPDTTKIVDDYDTAYVGVPLTDTIMQHNKETFVIYGCAYCHGLYLTPVGEAADLRKSTIVGARCKRKPDRKDTSQWHSVNSKKFSYATIFRPKR